MAIKKRPASPRQKMINLMYVVLMAMLALNVSSEVLEGFGLVEDSLRRTTAGTSQKNESLYHHFAEQMKTNPAKVKAWFEKATEVKESSDSLYNLLQTLKERIVKEADGEEADINHIVNKENLDAAGQIMLAPGSGQGKKLFQTITAYRERILTMLTDERQKKIIAENLSTAIPKNTRSIGKNWQEYMFENMPVSAAVTLLTKLQSDVRYAEGEVLYSLANNIDVKDIRVNKLDAFVIPEKTTLYPGETFSANIVMAAIDSTQQPEVFVNGSKVQLRGGKYSFTAGSIGEHSFSGYLTMRNGAGDLIRRSFTQKYEVVSVPTSATVAADLMNVLYAGYSNPVSVSVSGIPQNAIQLSMTGGSLTAKGNGRYVAVPATVGKDVTFNVTANDKGKTRSLGQISFRVRKLPDPMAYIAVGGDRFKGGGLAKASLMGATGIHAAIDDGILDIQFKVVSFETVFFDNMGNAIPMASAGSQFSDRQREAFRSLSRNKRFYITNVTAVGPDGLTRKLAASTEVIVK